jgi:hypothetical protein
VPSLRVRTDELSRIVDEYAIDAVAELRALRASFTDADSQWVLDNAPLTLPEIEKATLRLVAIRVSRNVSDAAARLGMAPVSLSRWVGRRKLPPRIAHAPGLVLVGTPAREHDHCAPGEQKDEPTDVPEGTRLELVSADNDAEERAELGRELRQPRDLRRPHAGGAALPLPTLRGDHDDLHHRVTLDSGIARWVFPGNRTGDLTKNRAAGYASSRTLHPNQEPTATRHRPAVSEDGFVSRSIAVRRSRSR